MGALRGDNGDLRVFLGRDVNGFSGGHDFGGPAGTCRKPSRVARQQSPPLVPHTCQSTGRPWADRPPSVHWPRMRVKAERRVKLTCSMFASPSFTTLPPLAQDCSRFHGGIYARSKNRI